MSLRIKIEHGQDAGRIWRLTQPGVYVLGRHPGCSIRVLDMKVSKEHCEVHLTGADRAVLKDLGSTHGCQVNAQPVRGERPLQPGDELRLGLTILRVLSDGTADAEAAPVKGRTALDGAPGGADGGPGAATKKTLADDALVGKELAGYRIERKIGQGGMGGVYLAEQVSLRRKVALKVLSEKFASDSAFVDQFLNEARAAGQLNHPNVVQVYDVGQADGQYFFSMEVMPGGSVEDRLREGPVEWPVALNYFIDAANALIFAHRRGILHRDVKPDNLMISEAGDAKLCDLGLAKRSEVSDLMDQGIIGTPHFIAPEAIRRRSDIDHRADLYSLGCTFYRVLTRHNPFPGQSVKEILLGHLNKPAPSVLEHNKEVPRELGEVIQKLMAKEPDERYQTPDDLLRALDRIRTQYHLEAHGLRPPTKRPLILAAVVTLLALGGAAFVVLSRNGEPPVPQETEEMRLARLETMRSGVANRLKAAVTAAREERVGLQGQYSQERLGSGTWKKPRWAQIAGDMKAAADRFAEQVEAWQEERKTEEDEVVRAHYDTHMAELEEVERAVRTQAEEIETAIAKFRRLEQRIQEGREQALADLAQAVGAHASLVQGHLLGGRYVELEEALAPAALAALGAEILQRVVEDVQLLDAGEDLTPLLDQHFPLADPKDPASRGRAYVDKAVQLIEGKADEALAEMRRLLEEDAGPEGLARARAAVEAALEAFPAGRPAEAAPRTTGAIARARLSLTEAADALGERIAALRAQALAQDRLRYYRLVQLLRRPHGRLGLLPSFSVQLAKDAVQQALKAMGTAEFTALVRGCLADAEALEALLANARQTLPEWTNDKVEVDVGGRTRRGRIKALTPTGVVLEPASLLDEREEIPYADLGPAWLLAHVFFAPPERSGEAPAPRFAFGAADWHGLALVAEMAGLFSPARRFWEQAEAAYGDDPGAAVVRERRARLDLEEAAATRWFGMLRTMLEFELWRRTRDPALIGLEAFDKDPAVRENILTEEKDWRRRLQQAQALGSELQESPELAGTTWATALRDGPPHPQVSYAAVPAPEGGWPEAPR